MAWTGVITNVGQGLLDQWAAGDHTLTITKVTVGSGLVAAESMRSSTALVSEQATAAIVKSEPIENGTKIRIQVGPAATTAYTAKEVGIWARLDTGAETLLALHEDAAGGTAVPTAAQSPDFAFVLIVTHAISNTDDLEVTVDSTANCTIADLEDAVADIRADIKILDFTREMAAREDRTVEADISAYIDDADNYIVLSCAQYITRGTWTDTRDVIAKWRYQYVSRTDPDYVADVWPIIHLYNSDSKRYLHFSAYNATDRPRDVIVRVVLLKKRTVISVPF